MKQLGLKFFTDTYLTVLGLIIFLGYFVFIAIQTMKMKKQKVSYLESIPLESED